MSALFIEHKLISIYKADVRSNAGKGRPRRSYTDLIGRYSTFHSLFTSMFLARRVAPC